MFEQRDTAPFHGISHVQQGDLYYFLFVNLTLLLSSH